MFTDRSRSLASLPFAPGCGFKPRSIGIISDSLKNYYFGGYVSFHIVVSGTGYVEWEGRRRVLHKGDLFSILPGINVRYYGDPDDPWSFSWVDIIGPAAVKMANQAGFTAEEITRCKPQFKELLLQKFQHVLDLVMKEENDPCVYGALILNIVSLLHERRHFHRTAEELIADLQELLSTPQNLELNVNSIAATLQVERTTLFHACRNILGASPIRILLEYKINYCKELLRNNPQLSLSEIAEKSTFRNDRYFIRAFKRETGMTPFVYRKKFSSTE